MNTEKSNEYTGALNLLKNLAALHITAMNRLLLMGFEKIAVTLVSNLQ